MNKVPPKGKHPCRITVDDVAFYYSKGCKVFPTVHTFYIDSLSNLESQGKVCFTPAAILERYHMNFKKRIEQKVKKTAQK